MYESKEKNIQVIDTNLIDFYDTFVIRENNEFEKENFIS